MAYLTDADAARAAFTTATTKATNAVNSLFSSYGFTRQGAGGAWNTGTAGSAFDPNNFLTLANPATGEVSVDETKLQNLFKGDFGVGFGYNKLTDVLSGGASREALAKAALRGRGITGGGLTRQAGTAAEATQGREVGALASELLGNLGNIYGNVGSAVTGAVESNIETAGTGAQTISGATSVVNTPTADEQQRQQIMGQSTTTDTSPYRTLGTPGGTPPRNPNGGQLYTGPGGVTWQYRINGPSGRGWYKK